MNKILTAKQIQKLDQMTINDYHIASLILMENAGRAAAKEILNILKKTKNPSVSIFCGTGNNGGDGFVIARYLLNAGIKVRVFIVGKINDLKNDSKINLKILRRLGKKIKVIRDSKEISPAALSSPHIVVDAFFGVGLNRLIGEPYKGIIEKINQYAGKIIAVDVPSGLDATTGKIWGACIKADKTITFSFAKKGFLINNGPQYTGKIKIVDIGIPKELKNKISNVR